MVWSCAFLLILILGSAALFAWLRGNPHSYPGPSQHRFDEYIDDRAVSRQVWSINPDD